MAYLDPFTYDDGVTWPSDELSAMGSHYGGSFLTTADATTTNSSFETMAGISFQVRCSYPGSYMRLRFFVSAFTYATVAGTEHLIGIRINGFTTDCAHIRHDDGAVKKAITGFVDVVPPAIPGFYLAELMWRRSVGTGVVTLASGTLVTCLVREK